MSASWEAELPVPIGSLVAGKYRIDKVLGVGGMGIVALGHHVKLDQKVAIKLLRPAAMLEPDLVARFAREARAVAKIGGEHVARVADVGETEGGVPFMVMEYLEGADLAALAKIRGKLPATEAVDYVLQACEALVEAHREGIVHRDLKPANLFVTQRSDGSPLVKILDFGISKLKRDTTLEDDDVTNSNVMIGSPRYMSPEQLRCARDVDGRTDIWALGAILYRLISGELPFSGEATAQLCVSILTLPLVPLSARVPGISRSLDATVTRCLEKDANARFQTVAELAEALGVDATDDGRSSSKRILRSVELAGLPHQPQRIALPSVHEVASNTLSVDMSFGGTASAPRTRTRRSLGVFIGAGIGLAAAGAVAWVAIPRHAPISAAPVVAAAATATSLPIATHDTASDAPPVAPLASSKPPEAAFPAASVKPSHGSKAHAAQPPPSASVVVATPPAPSSTPPPDSFSEFGHRK